MSWQDELRRLDEELAAGRISADDYRSRRDQILSTAVSPGAQPAPSASESTTMIPPLQTPGHGVPQPLQQAPQQPFPQQPFPQQPFQQQPQPQQPQPPTQQPPTQQQQGADGGEDADKTQIVPGQNVGDAERTQSVGGWRANPPNDSATTQVVPGVPPQAHAGARPPRPAPPPQASPPGGFPQPNQPPWQNEEELAPPWAGQEFPPLAAAGTPDWARQGPEVFETEKKSSAGKVFGIIAIVVVLLGIAAGAYFLFRPDEGTAQDDGNDRQSQEQAPPSTSEAPPGPVVDLPGEVSNMSKIKTFAQVEDINYLTPQEINLYQQGGAGDAEVKLSKENGVDLLVLYTSMESDTAAATARDGLAALQLNFTLKEREAPEGVLAAVNENAEGGPLLRAHYASGDSVVRVEAKGATLNEASELFDEVLDAQLERLPADG
ncbi:flagellar basal body-associated FliL family protein [Actinophytocola xanthii]|uniref:Uncharacterized protein n=1 Tax=Actinophytocola xanthii TaxID=1912961 RepID=A0A1Q8CVI3_9PSEU|nr:hypothetical protein [Actinophytocola xanthii]OLF18344.1 hypothetical protein BU204_07335 [Actinophytocola xanthii]